MKKILGNLEKNSLEIFKRSFSDEKLRRFLTVNYRQIVFFFCAVFSLSSIFFPWQQIKINQDIIVEDSLWSSEAGLRYILLTICILNLILIGLSFIKRLKLDITELNVYVSILILILSSVFIFNEIVNISRLGFDYSISYGFIVNIVAASIVFIFSVYLKINTKNKNLKK